MLPPLSSSKPSASFVPSAAPALDDFTPPEPTPSDPHPGYYQLPSGSWAQYDPAYYQSYYKKWQKDYDKYIKSLEKGVGVEKGFEDVDKVGISGDIDPIAEMEKAKVQVKELEERKQLTQAAGSAPEAPRMNIQGAKLGGRARSRHQLTTLLTEAYQNREALEEQIAQGRRNRKEAGMKYGQSI
jgi:proline-rich protein PRCC